MSDDDVYHAALAVPVSEQDHQQGLISAPITLLQYGDYQCPYTASTHQVITRLQRKFGDQLRFVFRHFPLFTKHRKAQLAAEAAEAAAAQGKFWDMHGYLFQNQIDLDLETLERGAKLLELDFARLNREIAEHVYLEKIQADAEGGKRSSVASTPALFLNGFMYDASDDFETLSRNIEALLSASGVKVKKSFWSGLFK